MGTDGGSRRAGPAYRRRIRRLGRALGIAADYATARQMTLQPEATVLVSIGTTADGADIRLEPLAAAAWRRMSRTARRSGITLLPISGFRSAARQAEIVRRKLAAGTPLLRILRSVAAPGYSEHHSGQALDIGAPGKPALTEGFARTAAFGWLRKHAGHYGFSLSFPKKNPHKIGYEPWHWRYQSES